MASCDTHVPNTGENIAPTESVDNQRLSPATNTNGPNKVNGDHTPSESLESTGASQSVIDPTPESEPISSSLETRKVARAKKRDIGNKCLIHQLLFIDCKTIISNEMIVNSTWP
jgi:hypothetical protein